MSKVKAVVDFSGYDRNELAPIAQMIHDKMLANVATFPATDVPVAMTALATVIADYMAKLAARASNASSDVLAFNMARTELEGDLAELGHYVNMVAKGDPVIVDKSGFPSYSTERVVDRSPPAAPTNVRLRHGELSGSVLIRCTPARAKSFNRLQTCTGDPNVEANWHDAAFFPGGRFLSTGHTPATTVWFRIQTAGLDGVMGAWSDPAKIIVV